MNAVVTGRPSECGAAVIAVHHSSASLHAGGLPGRDAVYARNPLTGRGLGARGFGSATLLVDLLAECGIDGSEPSGRARMMQR